MSENNNTQRKQKIKEISGHFSEILYSLGIVINDSTENTAHRVAKMLVDELCHGLFSGPPDIMVQDNKLGYDQMIIQAGMEINGLCEHHFLPILGKCHIAYIPGGKIIGLSKLSRIARWHSARPHVQEELTQKIKNYLEKALETPDIAVAIDGRHLCMKIRGIKDSGALTRTTALGGAFRNSMAARNEFLSSIPKLIHDRP